MCSSDLYNSCQYYGTTDADVLQDKILRMVYDQNFVPPWPPAPPRKTIFIQFIQWVGRPSRSITSQYCIIILYTQDRRACNLSLEPSEEEFAVTTIRFSQFIMSIPAISLNDACINVGCWLLLHTSKITSYRRVHMMMYLLNPKTYLHCQWNKNRVIRISSSSNT